MLREVWLGRLETCSYRQGYDVLASCDHAGEWQYCPLGDACELFLERGGILPVAEESQRRIYDGESSFLPEGRPGGLRVPLRARYPGIFGRL
jgi:hypothetical protein